MLGDVMVNFIIAPPIHNYFMLQLVFWLKKRLIFLDDKRHRVQRLHSEVFPLTTTLS